VGALKEGPIIRLEIFKEYGKILGIAGFKEARITEVPAFIEAAKKKIGSHTFQMLDADNIAGWVHLYFAVLNALKAFQDSRNLAERLDVEILLYASGQDQINKAFTIVGLTPQTRRIALVTLTESEEEAAIAINCVAPLLGVSDDSVLEIDEEKFKRLREVFSISDEELEAVAEPGREFSALTLLLIERCALLSVHR